MSRMRHDPTLRGPAGQNGIAGPAFLVPSAGPGITSPRRSPQGTPQGRPGQQPIPQERIPA
jgi:hypothetical protein